MTQKIKRYGTSSMPCDSGIYVLHAEYEALERERDALRADAERYRWLCDGNGYFLEEAQLCGHTNEKAEADAAIDAARGAK